MKAKKLRPGPPKKLSPRDLRIIARDANTMPFASVKALHRYDNHNVTVPSTHCLLMESQSRAGMYNKKTSFPKKL